MSKGLGIDQREVYHSTNIDISKLVMVFHVHIDASLLAMGGMLS